MLLKGASIVLAVVVLLASTPVRADPQTSTARAEFDRGLVLVDSGAFAEAAQAFAAAYRAKPNAAVLYNLGLAHLAAGNRCEAMEALERYLAASGNAAPAERRARAQDELARARPLLGRIEVASPPGALWLRLDTRQVELPLPEILWVEPGVVRVVAPLGKDGVVSRLVAVAPGELVAVDFADRLDARFSVSFECAVPGVEVVAHASDGSDEVVGTTPLGTRLAIPARTVELRFSRPGYRGAPLPVKAANDSATTLICKVEMARWVEPSIRSRLVVDTSEDDAQVVVDGTPWSSGASGVLPAGPHAVVVRKWGFHDARRSVTSVASEEVALRVHLDATEAYREGYEDAAGRWRFLGWSGVGAGAGLAVAGGITLGVAESIYQDWSTEQELLDQGSGGARAGRQQENNARLGDVHELDGIAAGLGVAGGALLVGGVLALILGPDPHRYDGAPARARRVAVTW